MGQYEVLGVLVLMRNTGDHRYFRYAEIHELMKKHGLSCSYTVVWRCTNSLFSSGLLELHKEGGLLNRTLKFRAKIPTKLHTSGVKEKYNANRAERKSPVCAIPRSEFNQCWRTV